MAGRCISRFVLDAAKLKGSLEAGIRIGRREDDISLLHGLPDTNSRHTSHETLFM
jgi:hypothetical protein